MELSKLTKEELDVAFKQASANRESLTPFVEEMKKRMNAPKKTDEPEIVDPGTENICVGCE